MIEYDPKGNRVFELDLQSGEKRTLFQAPENSWLGEAVVSPDNRQILLTYAPPPPSGETQFGYSDLYLIPYDGSSAPQPLLTRSDPMESYYFTTWAADGQSIYYTHYHRTDPNSQVPTYQNDLVRAPLGGQATTIVQHGLWPALSRDGTKLAYLYEDLVTFSYDLYVANADGSNPVPVLQPAANPPIDAHVFTLDGNDLIFSMVNFQPQPTRTWLDRLLGVQIASAHSVPSDWYRVALGNQTPQRLTNMDAINLNGALSPDGRQLAFIAALGVYVMNVDGSNLNKLSDDIMIGTLNWIP